jgi:LCP family protein required for cell wall assembly
LFVGRRRDALVFLIPSAAIVGLLVGTFLAVGWIGVLKFIVTPGVLPVLAVVNIAIALWRILAALDGARLETPTRRSLGLAAVSLAVLLAAPHLVAGRLIASTDDFLDSFFATTPAVEPSSSLEPEPTDPEPLSSPQVDHRKRSAWTIGDEPAPTPAPTPTPAPLGPYSGGGGTGSLPELGAAVYWDAPGAIPWGNDGRFDLLLLGSDAGSDRWSRRMDVMLLVEIDVASGNVAMIGLPRNLRNAPYPPGFARDAVECGCMTGLLNEVYVEATARHPDRWPGKGAIKGIGAVRGVVSELTGRPIDAVLVADLMGVIRVVDAMGGIDIYVPSAVSDDHYPDPIFGSIDLYIKAGQQHMDGRIALAYARSRHGSSDYARMARQQTLLLAIRDQLGPAVILQAPDLFAAAKRTAWTDLPRDSLPALVELFAKAANGSVKHLRIVPPTYSTYLTKAEIARIQADIAKLLGTVPPPTPSPSPSPTPDPSGSPSGNPSGSPSPSPSATTSPSGSPSGSPTPGPTPGPSPSVTPSPSPSSSPAPSSSPTTIPTSTASPSSAPT